MAAAGPEPAGAKSKFLPMEQVTKPKVRTLASGSHLVTKQMEAPAGALLPKHLANLESILFIHVGECILHINDEDKPLQVGEAFVVPADTQHQIKALTDFRGIHIMPKEIEFMYFE